MMKNNGLLYTLLGITLVFMLAGCTANVDPTMLAQMDTQIVEKIDTLENEVVNFRAEERNVLFLQRMLNVEKHDLGTYEDVLYSDSLKLKRLSLSLRKLLVDYRNAFFDVFMRQPVHDDIEVVPRKPSVLMGWSLIVDLANPIPRNSLLYGGDVFFDMNTPDKEALFFVILTPARKDSGTTLPAFDNTAEGLEAQTGVLREMTLARRVTEIVRKKRGVCYDFPVKGYRTAPPEGIALPDYLVIRDSFPLMTKNAEEPVMLKFVSEPCTYSAGKPGKKTFMFQTPVAAFAGDYVAIAVPNENLVHYFEERDASDTYLFDLGEINMKELLKSQQQGKGRAFKITRSNRQLFEAAHRRRAAFTLFGETMELQTSK